MFGRTRITICREGLYYLVVLSFIVAGAIMREINLLVVIAGTGDGRWWPWFGLVVGVGLFNKIGLLVLGMAVVAGLLIASHVRNFRLCGSSACSHAA